MESSKVYIEDYRELIDLQRVMDFWSESCLKFLNGVDCFFQERLNAYERLKVQLKKELEEAEERLEKAAKLLGEAKWELSNAQSELSSCTSSQHWDENEQCYRPSCSSEERSVASAQSHVEHCRQEYEECEKERDKCRERYEKADRIIGECRQEFENYKYEGGILRPSGAEKMLADVAENHRKNATKKLDEILEIVATRYLGRRLSSDLADGENGEMEYPEKFREGIRRLEDEMKKQPTKAQRFKEATQKIRYKQRSAWASVADADTLATCPGCHRKMINCTCPRILEKER